MFHKEIQGEGEAAAVYQNLLSVFPLAYIFFDRLVHVSIFSSVRIGFCSPELWLFRLRVSNLSTCIIFTSAHNRH